MNRVSMNPTLFLFCSLTSIATAMEEQKDVALRQQHVDPIAQWLSAIRADSEDNLQAKIEQFYDQYPSEAVRLLLTSVQKIQELQQELDAPDEATKKLEALIAQEIAEKQKLAQKKESLEKVLSDVSAIIHGMKSQVPERLPAVQQAADSRTLVAVQRQLRGHKGQSVKKTKRIKELLAEIRELKEKAEEAKAEHGLKRKYKATQKKHKEKNKSKKLKAGVAANTAETRTASAEPVTEEPVESAKQTTDASSPIGTRDVLSPIRIKIIPPAEKQDKKAQAEDTHKVRMKPAPRRASEPGPGKEKKMLMMIMIQQQAANMTKNHVKNCQSRAEPLSVSQIPHFLFYGPQK